MKRLARKALLAFIIACFLAMVTGVSLDLHLLSHKRLQAHDAEHCSTCQQLLVSPGKFVMEPQSSLPDSNLDEDNVEVSFQSCAAALHCKPFDPRPPPLA
ncbi:MAG: hypothetical protein A2Z25_23395 [Planctomycetes bacterium RBG_16_55_9]|nr:MAG: hypothetical protein A2Z25_23395 [Planctomycetes bacterium RBG_16_55_9]